MASFFSTTPSLLTRSLSWSNRPSRVSPSQAPGSGILWNYCRTHGAAQYRKAHLHRKDWIVRLPPRNFLEFVKYVAKNQCVSSVQNPCYLAGNQYSKRKSVVTIIKHLWSKIFHCPLSYHAAPHAVLSYPSCLVPVHSSPTDQPANRMASFQSKAQFQFPKPGIPSPISRSKCLVSNIQYPKTLCHIPDITISQTHVLGLQFPHRPDPSLPIHPSSDKWLPHSCVLVRPQQKVRKWCKEGLKSKSRLWESPPL